MRTGILLSATLLVAAAERPNIVWIFSDDHTTQAISAYGHPLAQVAPTPQIDRLAREGMRFDRLFCTNAICGPSRAALLTGAYSHVSGFYDNQHTTRLDMTQPVFPRLLRQAGYQTAIVGKWHLTSDPGDAFDHAEVIPGQGVYNNPKMGGVTLTGYVTDLITDHALAWLDRRDAGKPFLLMVHHKAPHREWTPAERHRGIFTDVEFPVPESFTTDYGGRAAAKAAAMRITEHMGKHDLKQDPPAGLAGRDLALWKWRRYLEDYLGCVRGVDENVGRVLDYLDAKGLAQNTLVMYSSDQGFYLGENGWYDKRFMYDTSLRMPLLARWPGRIQPGSVQPGMALNVDFAPTFCELAGVPVPERMQGRSLVPLLHGPAPADWRRSMYYHYYEFPQPHHVHPHYGVRTDRYKLMHFYFQIDTWELYDLEADPTEQRNLYGQPELAQVQAELRTELARLQRELRVPEREHVTGQDKQGQPVRVPVRTAEW